MSISSSKENNSSIDNNNKDTLFRKIIRHLDKDLDLIQITSHELRDYFIRCSKIIALIFGIEYLYSALKSFYYSVYDDFTVNIASAFVFFLLLKYKLTTKINIIRIMIYIFIGLTFYHTSFFGYHSGVFYNYLHLILIMPYIFDLRINYKEIIFILLLCLSSVGINYVTDFSLFYNSRNTIELQHGIFAFQIAILIFNFIFFLYMVFMGNKIILQIYGSTFQNVEFKSPHIESPSKNYKELEHLALSSPSAFIIKFNEVFPSFCESLQQRFPELSKGELELCCYLKMNFSTKEIAIATNSSIRSIDSKKYRLRKKLNLDSSEKIYQFFIGNEEF